MAALRRLALVLASAGAAAAPATALTLRPQPGPTGRGVGDGKSGRAEDLHLLSSLSWYYSWGLSPSPQIANTSFPQEFVAMA